MPVHMGHQVAETGQIDLEGLVQRTQCRFGRIDQRHQVMAISSGKIAHFAHMLAPDHTAEAGVIRPFLTDYSDDTAALIFPENLATRFLAQLASWY